jgi:peptide/nickel transport system substrate-binding protein
VTSEDIAFTVRMFKDPAGTLPVPRGVGFVGEVTTPDAQTAVLRYARLFNGAAVAGLPEFPIVPRHRLADEYARVGAEGLANHAYWTTEYVGAGPYRLTSRTLGSEIAAEAFDRYVFGRPHIDRIVVHFMADVNAIVASLLAGETDVVIVGTLDPHDAAPLQQQWEKAGKGTVGIVPVRVRQMQLQYRDPTLPWAGDVRVRQAMLHLIDRQGLVETIHEGLSSVADVALPASSPAYALLQQRGIPKYAFDRTQAERLLDAAGWVRGADGMRRNNAGAAFVFNPAIVGAEDSDEVLVIVDGMKAAGISSEPNVIDNLAVDVNEQRAKGHSIARTSAADDSYWDRFLAAQTASSENRWRGANTGGYSNPGFDRLVGQWVVSLEPSARTEREAELHKLLIDDLVYLPLFFDPEIYAFRRGLVGPKPFAALGRNVTFDVQTWTLD